MFVISALGQSSLGSDAFDSTMQLGELFNPTSAIWRSCYASTRQDVSVEEQAFIASRNQSYSGIQSTGLIIILANYRTLGKGNMTLHRHSQLASSHTLYTTTTRDARRPGFPTCYLGGEERRSAICQTPIQRSPPPPPFFLIRYIFQTLFHRTNYPTNTAFPPPRSSAPSSKTSSRLSGTAALAMA